MKPYSPYDLPFEDELLDPFKLVTQVSEATASLSEYNGMLKAVPNPRILLSSLSGKEAELSSRIEGTQASYEDVLEQEAGEKDMSDYIREDIKEIINYRNAMIVAEDIISEGHRGISLGLVLELHQQLLSSVRGEDKTPGKFRVTQNWIGKAGCKMEEATFIPPNPMILQTSLENWQKYVESEAIEPLIQTAIMHAQFELIHPFLDGNGRIGRLLIPLMLYRKGRLSSPNFYLSEYLEAHRDEYYENLKKISAESDWMSWITFFLKAVKHQADTNISRVLDVIELYTEMKDEVQKATNSSHTNKLIDAIFMRPIFTSNYIGDHIGVANKTTINTLIKKLVDSDIIILIKQGRGPTPSRYAFTRLLEIVN